MPAPNQGSIYEKILIYPIDGGKSFDIRGGVVQMQYFEDLYSPTFTATVQVVSTEDVYNTLPIRGGEKVEIHVTTPIEKQRKQEPGVFEVTMYVNKISGYVQEKQMQMFTLHLVSKEAIVNQKKRVVKKYLGQKISEIIKDLLQIVEAENIEEIEETQNPYNFVGNMRKPYTLAPMLAARGIPVGANSNSAGFFLWQTRKGIYFKSVEKIITNKEIKETYYFNRTNDSSMGDPNKIEDNFTKVLTYAVDNNNNIVNNSKIGEYSTYRIYFNPNTFEFINSKYIPEQAHLGTSEEKIPEEANPETIDSVQLAHRIVSGILDVGCLEPGVSKEVNYDQSEDVGQAISRYSSLFTQTVTFECSVNVNLTAGDVIKLIFPKVTKDNEVDNEQSGLYIIKEISHFWSPNRSFSAIKVVRDTSGL